MTSSPLPIRRATGSTDLLAVGGREALSSTPGGANMFGTTPGGTRIVYSREQLLSLASSPLSQTPPRGLCGASLPREISRSPEKASAHGIPGIGGSTPSMPGAFVGSFGRSPEKSSLRSAAVFNRSSLSGASNGGGVARSPPGGRIGNGTTAQPEARSPGNAFNFTSGPVSPTTARSTQSGIAAARPNAPAATDVTTTKKADEEAVPARRSGEEQFDMEM